MSASKTDYQIASLAAGFTLGFGFLTVWEASKQTRRNKNPLRSTYVYMLWGEIVVNIAIGIIGWIFLDGIIGPTVPVLFFILFLWVFEVQLLMQIIINRIAIIAESKKHIEWMKWGTAAFITMINIAVFSIWIPAHTNPPVSQVFVSINKYWDRMSKVLILLVDAGLNWYFLHIVKKRLLEQHGLMKYKPLVSFNTRLMILSVAMDAMLIGLMSLPNEVVYIQFHPVAYLVKLNIEMSMASLITRLAQNNNNDAQFNSLSYSNGRNQTINDQPDSHDREIALKSYTQSKVKATPSDSDSEETRMGAIHGHGIHRTMDFEVTVHPAGPKLVNEAKGPNNRGVGFHSEDEMSLTHNVGHPR